MNKWLILIASAFLCLGAAYTLPVAFKYPSAQNLLIAGAITAFAVLGLVMFFMSLRTKQPKIEGLRPITD